MTLNTPRALKNGGRSIRDDYLLHWTILKSDESKMRFLLMLKERAQHQGDRDASVVLLQLVERWVKEPYAS